jgi:hypothetical protein
MARLNEDGQWIIMMAFIICIILIFLALIVNESILVGQTTAEGVIEFSKSDIQDLKNEVARIREVNCTLGSCNATDQILNITDLSLSRKATIVNITISPTSSTIHFNNGINDYTETRIYVVAPS